MLKFIVQDDVRKFVKCKFSWTKLKPQIHLIFSELFSLFEINTFKVLLKRQSV